MGAWAAVDREGMPAAAITRVEKRAWRNSTSIEVEHATVDKVMP
jgi:hypothetical protein